MYKQQPLLPSHTHKKTSTHHEQACRSATPTRAEQIHPQQALLFLLSNSTSRFTAPGPCSAHQSDARTSSLSAASSRSARAGCLLAAPPAACARPRRRTRVPGQRALLPPPASHHACVRSRARGPCRGRRPRCARVLAPACRVHRRVPEPPPEVILTLARDTILDLGNFSGVLLSQHTHSLYFFISCSYT